MKVNQGAACTVAFSIIFATADAFLITPTRVAIDRSRCSVGRWHGIVDAFPVVARLHADDSNRHPCSTIARVATSYAALMHLSVRKDLARACTTPGDIKAKHDVGAGAEFGLDESMIQVGNNTYIFA